MILKKNGKKMNFTQEELRKLAQNFENESNKTIEDTDTDYSDSGEEEPKNLIIESLTNCRENKKKQPELFLIMAAQRELEIQKIFVLEKKKAYLKSELSREETKHHYLRLDYSNLQVEVCDQKKTIKYMKNILIILGIFFMSIFNVSIICLIFYYKT